MTDMKTLRHNLLLLAIAATVVLFAGCPSDDGYYSNTYSADPALLNPERGWYMEWNTSENRGDLADFRDKGVSIVLMNAELGKQATISTSKINEIKAAFNAARNAGLSVVFRAAYDFDGDASPEPTNINTIVGHINQLKLIFEEHEDILFNVQAGFLGSWGEWHSTYYGNKKWDPPYIQYQRTVGNELLAAVPSSVTVAFRRPEYIRNIADTTATGNNRGDHAAVTKAEAFGTSKIARMAFHNDALMSNSTDMDTYKAPNYPRETELNWISQQTRYTPMVGETNTMSGYNDIPAAIQLLNRINITSLNLDYHPGVLGKWNRSQYGGMNAFNYISMRMGYRFVLKKANITLNSNSTMSLDLEIVNEGFGHLLKEKDLEIVLIRKNQSQTTHRTTIYEALPNKKEDARFWEKDVKIERFRNFRLPSNMAAGSEWDVYLGLTSTFSSLKNKPAYSVRFYGNSEWDPDRGFNKIGTITITTATGGGSLTFAQIP